MLLCCHNAECHYDECHYAECRDPECQYPEYQNDKGFMLCVVILSVVFYLLLCSVSLC
jgi:hypothetical protein